MLVSAGMPATTKAATNGSDGLHIEAANELDFAPVGKVFPSPIDWRDQVMYQLLIDRFDDGKDYAAL